MQIALLETVIVQPGAELSTNPTAGDAAVSNAPDGQFAQLLATLTGLVDGGETTEGSDAVPEEDAPDDTVSSEIDTVVASVIADAASVVPALTKATEVQAEVEAVEVTVETSGSSLADRILFARANLTALLESVGAVVEDDTGDGVQSATVNGSSKGPASDAAMAALTASRAEDPELEESPGPVVSVLVAKTGSRDLVLPLTTEVADEMAGQDADLTALRPADMGPPPATRSSGDTFVEAMLRSLLRSDRGDASADKSAAPQGVQHGNDQPVVNAVEPRAERIVSGTDLLADAGKSVPATPQGLRDATVRSVQYLVGHGEQSLRVRLVPASLGELHVMVTTSDDGGLNVQLSSAHHAVRETLDGQLSGLRDALARDGIEVGRITVSPHMGTDTGSMPSGDRQPAGQPWRSGREDGEGYPHSGEHGSRQRQFVHEGALDLLA